MTREEAKLILEDIYNSKYDGWNNILAEGKEVPAFLEDDIAALKLAIEALSQPERPKGRWIPTHEHMWRKYDGEIDTDAWESGYHNGPVCELCRKHICINCNPDWAKDECDIESYRCSECNHHVKEKTEYCPHCGSDNRGEEE